ncbi:MAG TPA: TRAP transporter substrate-binding protein DctP, partial [Syntrophorhabdaceae bacterium]|nr:TRAP transporter substrate-binding protein DctP [Syntrophorhabdaceae bacterium]
KPLQWQGMVNEIISRKPVRKLADVKGLRIKVIGDYSKVFAALGAEGVSISNADVYVNMQKGILDATTAPMEVVESLKFADVAKYVPMFGFYPAPQSQRAMNLSKWKSLPPDIQKVFENNVDYWEQVTLEAVAAANAHAMEFGKKAGVEFIPISAEDKAKLQTLTVSIAEKDAKDLDAKGIRATQILQESQRLIKQYAK